MISPNRAPADLVVTDDSYKVLDIALQRLLVPENRDASRPYDQALDMEDPVERDIRTATLGAVLQIGGQRDTTAQPISIREVADYVSLTTGYDVTPALTVPFKHVAYDHALRPDLSRAAPIGNVALLFAQSYAAAQNYCSVPRHLHAV